MYRGRKKLFFKFLNRGFRLSCIGGLRIKIIHYIFVALKLNE